VFVTSDVIGSGASAPTEQLQLQFGSLTADVTLGGTAFHSCFDVTTNSAC
jgi:hypothetical protein